MFYAGINSILRNYSAYTRIVYKNIQLPLFSFNKIPGR